MERAVSVKEMLHMCEKRVGRPARLQHGTVRPGDQPLYIADTAKLQALTGWAPRRDIDDILDAIETFWQEELQPRSVRREVPIPSELVAREAV
jgi:UDP-glucose 4-epimerase